jgi:hypothetical protein
MLDVQLMTLPLIRAAAMSGLSTARNWKVQKVGGV